MRKLKIIVHTSLDGVIQANEKEGGFPYGDWSGRYRSPAGLAMLLEKYGERFDVLLGRKTYDMLSQFWPKAPAGLMADRINAATKYIVTHRPESLEWAPCQGLSKDLLEDVKRLKSTSGPDLIVTGSSSLTSKLLEHDLVDELVLLVNPVLLGQGKKLFAEGTPGRGFELISSQATPTGILMNSYKPAGALPKA